MKIGVTEAVNYEKKYFVDLEIGTFFKRTKANENGWYVKVSEDEVYNSFKDALAYNSIWYGGDTPLLDYVHEEEIVEVANEVSFTIK